MREHLGEEYGGTVSAVTSFGLFVTLDALYVEGLVHITELGGEYYRFDEVRQELRGERTGVRYAVGTRVRVQVSRVDLDGRTIDFRLVRDGEPGLSASRAREASAPAREARWRNWLSVQEADRAGKAAARRKTGKKTASSRASRGQGAAQHARPQDADAHAPLSATRCRPGAAR